MSFAIAWIREASEILDAARDVLKRHGCTDLVARIDRLLKPKLPRGGEPNKPTAA